MCEALTGSLTHTHKMSLSSQVTDTRCGLAARLIDTLTTMPRKPPHAKDNRTCRTLFCSFLDTWKNKITGRDLSSSAVHCFRRNNQAWMLTPSLVVILMSSPSMPYRSGVISEVSPMPGIEGTYSCAAAGRMRTGTSLRDTQDFHQGGAGPANTERHVVGSFCSADTLTIFS